MADSLSSAFGLSSGSFLSRFQTGRPKINWFTSLPPAPTKIAYPVVDVLRELNLHCEITVWTSQEEWQLPKDLQLIVRHFRFPDVPWNEFHRGDLNFYNLADLSDYHAHSWLVSRHCPGVVILHIDNFQAFLAEYYLARVQDSIPYCELMERYHGRAGLKAAHELMQEKVTVEKMSEEFDLFGAAVEGALAVVGVQGLQETRASALQRIDRSTTPAFIIEPFELLSAYSARSIAAIASKYPLLREIRRRDRELRAVVDTISGWSRSPQDSVVLLSKVLN